MFYRPDAGHGLPHSPFNAIVAPRPIGWISTRGSDGQDNLAPYSFFNAVAYDPPQVMFASTRTKPDRGDTKDTVAHIQETGVFCVNVVSFAQQDQMNATAAGLAKEIDEFAEAGIEKADCESISCARVADSPAALECKLTQIVQLPGANNFAVFGEVTGVHLDDVCMTDGYFDPTKYHPLARMGYKDYAVIRDVFTLKRPGEA